VRRTRRRTSALHAASCASFSLGLFLLIAVLSHTGLPKAEDAAFAGAAGPRRGFLARHEAPATARRGLYEDQAAYMEMRRKKRRFVTDRGQERSAEEEAERKAEKEAMWNQWQRTGMDNVFEQKEVVITPAPAEGGSGGGLSLPKFEVPSISLPSFPAPAPAPSPASAPAPAPADGNPFAFLAELFQGTTTTTTTTPPPSPIESLFKSLGLR